MKGNFAKRSSGQKQDGYLYTMEVKPPANRSIDHMVYTVVDLDKSIDDFESLLGVRPIFGGYHRTFGTKNALINLDRGMYLELLAADETYTKAQARWMGIDVLTAEQLTRWAIKSNDLRYDSKVLKQHDPDMGEILQGSRHTDSGELLQWQLTRPLPLPEVELLPFCIDWSDSEIHPHQALPDMGCSLIELYGTHPNPQVQKKTLDRLGIPFRVERAPKISLKLILKSPHGVIAL